MTERAWCPSLWWMSHGAWTSDLCVTSVWNTCVSLIPIAFNRDPPLPCIDQVDGIPYYINMGDERDKQRHNLVVLLLILHDSYQPTNSSS
jgi:hypothetical protein